MRAKLIWIDEDTPYFYEESELADAAPPVVKYIRADIVENYFEWVQKTFAPVGNDSHPHNIIGNLLSDPSRNP